MNAFPGLLLGQPLRGAAFEGLLFGGFLLHMVFVLLTLGTAFIAVYYSLGDGRPPAPGNVPWHRRVLRTFIAHKSLAVALGVAPLLLIQLGHAVPFFNATSLLAPWWILIFVLLIPVSMILDSLAHHAPVGRSLHAVLAAIGLLLLLAVPAIFVAVLVAAEQSAGWLDIVRSGYRLTGALGLLWFFRYLHVLAAAIIFGALFHYIFTARGDRERRGAMLNWIVFGIMAQAVIGPMLTLTLVLRPDRTAIVMLFFGLLALAAFIRVVANAGGGARDLDLKLAVPFLLIIALFMLLVRQHQQDRAFSGLEAKTEQETARYAALLQPYEEAAVSRYKKDVETVYDNGPMIYGRSCAFCHGEDGDANGAEAPNLAVPPEAIAPIRSSRPYVYKILTAGIEGSAMPYFTVFTRDKLEMLIDLMNERWQILGPPPPVNGISPGDKAEAVKTYSQVCAGCHGPDGRPTPNALKFKPPPPDFTQYSLLPGRSLEVIDGGYRGTVMGPFGQSLRPEVRTALVQVLYDLRK
jgi:cytochrome c